MDGSVSDALISLTITANKLLVEGKYSAAITEYSKAIKESETSNVLLHCNRGTAYCLLELYKHALRDCNAALKLNDSFLRAHILKGEVLFHLGKRKQACAAWKKGIECPITENTDMHLLFELKQKLEKEENKGDEKESIPPPIPVIPIHNSKGGDAAAAANVASRGLVQHGVGDASVDEQIALGYLQVNTGNYKQGVILFDKLIKKYPAIVAPYLGRGTAFALMGNLGNAIADFSAALTIDSKCVDALKRRAQCYAAGGDDRMANADLKRAFEAEPKSRDFDLYHQQGLLLYKQKDYAKALKAFLRALDLDSKSKLSWNHLGLCQNALGESEQAIASYNRAVSIDSGFKEAWTNLGQAYKDFGEGTKAEQHFTIALKVDPTHVQTYYLRAVARFSQGDHKGAIEDFSRALVHDPSHVDSLNMRAVAQHGIGLYKAALQDYDRILKGNGKHYCWYNREVLLFTHSKLDVKVNTFNMDRVLDPRFKEGWCKRMDHMVTMPDYVLQQAYNRTRHISDVKMKSTPVNKQAKRIIDACRGIGGKIQLRCAGYLANARQHRAAGLAAMEMGQVLRHVWNNGGHYNVSNTASSWNGDSSSSTYKKGKGEKNTHLFGWRDLYDIGVRWRQISEPNDPVWWVDRLSPQQFAEGFGSHTPMITGQTRVVRYSPMSNWAVRIMRSLIKDHKGLTSEQKNQVAKATSCKQLHDAFGRDFWVVTPCHSTARPGHIMEGTRLTIQYVAPNGYEHSIRTPGTPPRWEEYENEMSYIFTQLTTQATSEHRDLDKISELILTLTYYWYNFMPLSRGTAAVGFIALLGMFLSFNIEITKQVPKGQQVDWEGILRPNPKEFIEQIQPWLYPARKKTTLPTDLPSVSDTFSTFREMIQALNVT